MTIGNGPGKYDAEVTLVRVATEASTVVLVVIGGREGSGIAVQSTSPAELLRAAKMFRDLASHLERDAVAIVANKGRSS